MTVQAQRGGVGGGVSRIARLPCLLAQSKLTLLFAVLTVCLQRVHALHRSVLLVGLVVSTCFALSPHHLHPHCDPQPLFHQNTTVMAAGDDCACALAHVLARFLPPQLPPSERATVRPLDKTDPTGRVRFRVQSHFGLGVSLKCLYNLEIQNDGIPFFFFNDFVCSFFFFIF